MSDCVEHWPGVRENRLAGLTDDEIEEKGSCLMNAARKQLLSKHVDMEKWEAGKARARELVKESAEVERRSTTLAWAWADLCVEVVPEHALGPSGKGKKRVQPKIVSALLDAWIEEYGFPHSRGYLLNLREAARAWPRERRSKASFHAHQTLSFHAQRFTLIRDDMTVAEAQRIAGRKPLPKARLPKTASALERAHAVKTWSRSLGRLLPASPSEELVNAVADAAYEVIGIADRLGILDELVREYEEAEHGAVALAA